jgi:NAD(P)-dependent dehydrogenase (short-subunit alcohol dehydrogenase family)
VIFINIRELFTLKGLVAIVTGGRTGLGYQIATGLAEAGANLVIASRNYKLCKDACDDFKKKFKVDAILVKLDATNEKDIVNMINITVEHYGKVDILVNNVGGAIISDALVTKLTDWKYIIDLNLTSIFTCCREAGKYMVERRYGKIINIASCME